MRILSVVGARPNFMKIAPLLREIKKYRSLKHILVHTGQHYDYRMSESFFKELGIDRPQINLNVGSANHAQQTGLIMMRFEKVLRKVSPDVVVVVGDVNSTMACSLVATKLGIAVAHVEAGLRSFDRRMPEEINRLVTDSVADILLTSCRDANANLVKEGIPKNRIFFVGNIMIDTLMINLQKAKESNIMNRLGIKPRSFALVTLHRPSNVDSRHSLRKIFGAFEKIQKNIDIVFPVHPRTLKNIKKYISKSRLKNMRRLHLLDPLGYLDFLHLMTKARFVITDSGGIQEETTVLKIPCLTVRENTERPITVTQGSNILVGLRPQRLIRECQRILAGKAKRGRRPELWDGKTAQRIVARLMRLHKQKKLARQ